MIRQQGDTGVAAYPSLMFRFGFNQFNVFRAIERVAVCCACWLISVIAMPLLVRMTSLSLCVKWKIK
jgi:hypothetical protein